MVVDDSRGQLVRTSLIQRLVGTDARKELSENGVSCVTGPRSIMCVTTSSVRITMSGNRPVVYLSGGQKFAVDAKNFSSTMKIKPYPLIHDVQAMRNTAEVIIVSRYNNSNTLPVCDVTHDVPALVFSTGGYAGNFFHDINDVIIPLFLTVSYFESRIRLLVSDYKPYWVKKYGPILSHASAHDVVVDNKVHCFPEAVVGVKYHDKLMCNSSELPGGIDTLDFKRFLQESFSLQNSHVSSTCTTPPNLLLVSRRHTRVLLNEEQVIKAAKKVGFHVKVASPEQMNNVAVASKLVNSCNVLMGVHGAGLTNMVFLPDEAVLFQIVPLGLDELGDEYYGRGPAQRLRLKYLEYQSPAKESSLYGKYPKDHPVLTDPTSVNRRGYTATRPLYIDGQNVTVDITNLRKMLLQAMGFFVKSAGTV